MMVRKLCLPEINWSAQEEASARTLVKETLRRARTGTVLGALEYGTAAFGFDTFVFGIVANDRRPDAESRTYIITNQADAWIRRYDECAYLELDPRVELAGEPGYAFWEARHFEQNPRHRLFLTEAAAYAFAYVPSSGTDLNFSQGAVGGANSQVIADTTASGLSLKNFFINIPNNNGVGANFSRARCRNTALPRPAIRGRVLWSISMMKS